MVQITDQNRQNSITRIGQKVPDNIRFNPPHEDIVKFVSYNHDNETVMNALSKAYPGIEHRLGEIVDNTHDADGTELHINIVEIDGKYAITLVDNGKGMFPKIMQERFFLARNITREERGSNTLGANGVGAKGALYGISDRVDVISVPEGCDGCFVVGKNYGGLTSTDCPVSNLITPANGDYYEEIKSLWDEFGPGSNTGTIIILQSLKNSFLSEFSLPEKSIAFRDHLKETLGVIYDRIISDNFNIYVLGEKVEPANITSGGIHLSQHDQQFSVVHPETGKKVNFRVEIWSFEHSQKHNRFVIWRNDRFIGSQIKNVNKVKVNNQQEFEKVQIHVFVGDDADYILNIESNKTVDGSKHAHECFQKEIRARYKDVFDELSPNKKEGKEEVLSAAVENSNSVKESDYNDIARKFSSFAKSGGMDVITKPRPKTLGGNAKQYPKSDKQYAEKSTDFEYAERFEFLPHTRPAVFEKEILVGGRLKVTMIINLNDELNNHVFKSKNPSVKGPIAKALRAKLFQLLILEEEDGLEILEKCWEYEK